jgi:hypothetical protein
MIVAALLLAANLDACHVLTKREVAAVQGESFTAAKLTTRDELTQCFYQLPTFNKSISVDVIRDKEFWEQHFDRQEEHEREAEAHPPREIKGLGDDALWIGGRAAGSLYVRKGKAVLRVSVGGPGTEDEKIAKSKTLAVRALKRM